MGDRSPARPSLLCVLLQQEGNSINWAVGILCPRKRGKAESEGLEMGEYGKQAVRHHGYYQRFLTAAISFSRHPLVHTVARGRYITTKEQELLPE